MSDEEEAYRYGWDIKAAGYYETLGLHSYDPDSNEYAAFAEGYLNCAWGEPHLYDVAQQMDLELV